MWLHASIWLACTIPCTGTWALDVVCPDPFSFFCIREDWLMSLWCNLPYPTLPWVNYPTVILYCMVSDRDTNSFVLLCVCMLKLLCETIMHLFIMGSVMCASGCYCMTTMTALLNSWMHWRQVSNGPNLPSEIVKQPTRRTAATKCIKQQYNNILELFNKVHYSVT